MIIVDNVAKKNAEEFWKQFDNLVEKNENLQERINKAIEYINKFWKKKSYYEDVDNCMQYATMNEFDKEDLLDILKGDE